MQTLTQIPDCDWCGAEGADLGVCYGSMRLAKCTECHHEYQYVEKGR